MKRLITLCIILVGWGAYAQQEPRIQEGEFTFDTDKPFKLLDLDEEISSPIVSKKKKPRKKVYYGVKTKKGFTRKGFGDKITVELFYYLKRSEKPNTFVRDIYWYDFTRREIRRTSNFDPEKGVLLHGPYKKMQGEVVLEEGIYFKGTKHGRWMKYDRDHILDDKEKYYKGWPKESLVTHYDPLERKKVKEIIPIEFHEREGYYYLFHENGKIAVVGEYQWGERVGDWVENFEDGKRKKILTFPSEPFQDIRPYVKKEFNEQGREIYSNTNGQ